MVSVIDIIEWLSLYIKINWEYETKFSLAYLLKKN